MSSFLTSTLLRRATPAFAASRSSVRTISGSTAIRMPERSENSNSDPATLEKEKSRNLSDKRKTSSPHPESAPEWNEALASESEANVKAELHHDGPPTKDLQNKTVDHVQDKHGKQSK